MSQKKDVTLFLCNKNMDVSLIIILKNNDLRILKPRKGRIVLIFTLYLYIYIIENRGIG